MREAPEPSVSAELLEEVGPLAERFLAVGHRLYLVGGVVRDQLLGLALHPGTDLDLTTDAHPAEVKELVAPLARATWTQGERFGTIGCLIGDRPIEITTHRGESYDPTSRKPEVVYTRAIDEDLSRRDFTVNAMAVELPEGTLIDPFGGAGDLARARLRTPRSPAESFDDDPLRMLRAARFAAAYRLEPDEDLRAAVRAMGARLEIVSVERRRDEIDKLLVAADAPRGLQFLLDTGLVEHLLGGLAHRPLSAWEEVRDRVAVLAPLAGLRRTALLHLPGEDPARAPELGRELRLSNDEIRHTSNLVKGWEAVRAHAGTWTRAEVRELGAMAREHLEEVLALAATTGDVSELRSVLEELAATEDLDDLSVPLSGDDVMALLGVEPGPVVGEAFGWLRRRRLASGPLGRDEAISELRRWWAQREDASGS